MFTKRRGNNSGNIIAMIIGFIVVAILSGLPNGLANHLWDKALHATELAPIMEFPWWICSGTTVTFSVAIPFPDRARAPSAARLINVLAAEQMFLLVN
jgi:hypothetical protein